MWALPAWRERHGVRAGSELAWYGAHFSTVEGNTTFYATPSAETVARWSDQAPPDLRFCFKLPRHLTHERRLRDVADPLEAFLDRIAPLADRLGPLQVQLPASFGPADLGVLLEFLDGARDLTIGGHRPAWAVEVRHADFAAGGRSERPLNDALAEHGVNRVILDSRALFAVPPTTPEEQAAWDAKPRLPVRPVATASEPLVRLIGQTDLDASIEFWRPWFAKIAAWRAAGANPHVFLHTPDNVAAPELAHRVRDEVAAFDADLPPLPELSGDRSLW
jgi:uncharacterized protein YecE (DUF72 family)